MDYGKLYNLLKYEFSDENLKSMFIELRDKYFKLFNNFFKFLKNISNKNEKIIEENIRIISAYELTMDEKKKVSDALK